jgi:hypothetical protein
VIAVAKEAISGSAYVVDGTKRAVFGASLVETLPRKIDRVKVGSAQQWWFKTACQALIAECFENRKTPKRLKYVADS